MSSSRDYAEENIEIFKWIRDEGHQDFVALANECDAYAYGDQWDAEVKARLARRRKPTLTINKILATIATLSGEQITRQGDISFRSSAGGQASTAQALDKLWINFVQQQNLDWLESQAFLDGIIRSRGFLDLRISFDQNMLAEPELSYLNSKDVGLFPGDTGYDPDNWTGVMVSRWLSARDISEIYKVKVSDVMAFADSPELEADFHDWKRDSFGQPMYQETIIDDKQRERYRLFRILERQEWEYKTADCFVDMITGEVREIPTNWGRERVQTALAQYGYGVVKRRVKKINWTVSVGNLGLHKSISPYKHFTPVPYFPFLIGGKTVGLVEHLRDPQNLLNKTLSQELHIVAGIANSGFKVRQGALANMTPEQLQERGGEDGIVIEVTGDLNSVEKLQPNQVPTGLDRLSYKAGEVMQEISLVNDSLQGLNRSDESGKAIERKANMGSGALTPIYSALDQTRRIVARNWLDLVQEFVTEERVYHITTNARTAQTQEVPVNQQQQDGSFLNDLTLGEYRISITNVQSRSDWDMAQFDILMQLIRAGIPIPASEVVANLSIIENRDELVEFLRGQEGRTDPSEAQKEREQLEMRLLAAQAADKESSAAVKNSQAIKSQAEAEQTINGKDGDNSSQLDAAKMEQELMMKQEEMRLRQSEMQLKAQLEQQKAQLDQQKAQMDLQIAQQKLEFERAKLEMELQQARERHMLEMEKLKAQISMSKEKASIDLTSKMTDVSMRQQEHELNASMNQRKHEQDLASKTAMANFNLKNAKDNAKIVKEAQLAKEASKDKPNE
jgi:hypothetical protein